MAKRLALLRHAKSDWDTRSTDFDRPLNKRGRKDAPRIGGWLAARDWQPGIIISSPAVRARETIEAVVAAAGLNRDRLRFDEDLYLADSETILDVIRTLPADLDTALLVGHNPGMEDTLVYLSADPVPETDAGKGLTTANLAVLEVEGDWQDFDRGAARLTALIRPKMVDK